jgi:hypothetical protein
MLDRGLEQRRCHALPPLIRRDDEAHDRADRRVGSALDMEELPFAFADWMSCERKARFCSFVRES